MKKLFFVDLCYPDYYSFAYKCNIQIPVYPGMRIKDAINAIEDEISFCWDYYSQYGTAKEFTDAIAEMRKENDLRKSFPEKDFWKSIDMEDMEDMEDFSLYAFFTFGELTTKYGYFGTIEINEIE